MDRMSIALIFILITSLFYLRKWIKKRRKNYTLFKRLDVPYVKPHLIYGNFKHLKEDPKLNEFQVVGKWIEKYGKVFGYFIGSKPYFLISDLDKVKRILIKDFANFSNRPTLAVKVNPVIHTVVGLRDQRWKIVRSLLTPTFSSAKIRLMVEKMNTTIDVLFEIVERSIEREEPIEWYSVYQGLTLDVISECALAMKTNCQRDQNKDPFFVAVRYFLLNAVNPAVKLAIYFPSFANALALVCNKLALAGRASSMIMDNLKNVIKERRLNSKERKVDLLQLMLDAAEQNNNQSRMTMTDDEIIANAWVVLLGGFETTAASLTFTTYLLAKNPDKQEKLYQDIQMLVKDKNSKVSYDDVCNLPYLDQVFNESYRMYPPVVTFISREAKEDILINDLLIPRGTGVSIPIWHIHHDPKLWPNPDEFDPERFSHSSKQKSERHPMSFIPFGEGPRKCIGMRFAQMEAKLTLARILSLYRLEVCDKTPDSLNFTIPTVTLIPKEKVYINAIKR